MIKTENLYAEYKADEKTEIVLSDINLEIKQGEFLAVLGHNGSGKSTLAKHFNAIKLPSSGYVYVDELNTLGEKNVYKIRQKAGMVFQNPDNQMVSSVVEDDVAFAPENLGVPRDEIRARVDFALKAVGMYKDRFKSPMLLSGGQKQRVAIAGIIAMQPKYIILDEATAMLDPVGRKEVMDTVIQLNKKEKMTVIMITHFMEEAALADRVLVLSDGKVVMDDVPKKVFSEVERLKQLGLSVPPATELIYELGKAGFNIESDAITEEECIADILAYYKKRVAANDRA